MAECSFSKVSLKGVFEPVWDFHTDLYCRLLYLRSQDEQTLFCVFDTGLTWSADTRRFRKEVSEKCGIPEKSIVFHELQLHAAPGGLSIHNGLDTIIARVADEVNKMKSSAVPYTCEVAEAYMGTEYSFNREQYVEGLGGVTVWTGMGFDKQGKPCTRDEGIMLLRDYRPNLETLKEPLYFDNQNDPLAYMFLFKDLKGNVLGSVSRFAAHPDVAVLFELRPVEGKAQMYRYDFDWPGYLSQKLEEEFGGTSIYMNGPCADLTTKKGYDGIDDFISSDAECKRIGLSIAEKIKAEFIANKRPLKNADFLRTETFKVTVPMRDDMPKTVEEARNGQREKIEKAKNIFDTYKTDSSKTPAQVKRTVDEYYKAMYNGPMVYDICGFDDETLAKREVEIDIPCVRFGEYLFVGVPGESLVELTTWLRATFTGSKTIPLDQCDGYYSYVATPRSLTLGGYTYWCSWTTRDTIPELQKQLVPLIKEFLKD